MPETIICPICGETNPADMEFCKNCQSRLKPLGGTLRDESGPIQPGEIPTRKVTSELEPLLPQWLREARQQARESAADDASKAKQEPEEPAPQPGGDLLAGLASQTDDDDEDIPDWLSQITGAKSKKKKPVSDEHASNAGAGAKWVELGHERPEDEAAATPTPNSAVPESAAPNDELTDWFKRAAASSETADFRGAATEERPSGFDAPVPEEKLPEAEPQRPPAEELGWLRNLDANSSAPPEAQPAAEPAEPVREEVPDWLKRLQSEQTPPEAPKPPSVAPSTPQAEVPDWLQQFAQDAPASSTPEPQHAEPQAPEQALPDWLNTLGQSPAIEPAQLPTPHAPEEPAVSADLPDWISALGAPAEQPKSQEPEDPFQPGELPDWMSELGAPVEADKTEELQSTPDEALQPSALPDWISSLQPKSDEPEAVEHAAVTPPASEPDETPDWLSSLGGAELSAQPEAMALELQPEESAGKTSSGAFTPDAMSGEDVDAVFASMQMPDWLSSVLPVVPAEETPPAAAPADQQESIGPADLPSWVQAMRPVEATMGGTPAAEGDEGTERRGPLAGLRGVLPTVPGAAEPSSRPKPHSIKLDASEQQLAHAALLEQILAAETSPIPMKTGAVLRSQRTLRWAISAFVLLVVAAVVFSGSQIFALPTLVPNETIGAIHAVEAIPEDAPVLVVFDYQPATVGEMEAAGASLLDHLLLLKHPRLVLLSTSPTGAALAERFMTTTLASRAYARNQQYVDLGFLPGGLAGIYTFAQSPSTTMPLDAQSALAWQSAILAPVHNFSDFAAVIVLTDSLEAGRTWIEQTAGARGDQPMVIVSSAQAGPMLLPYVDSGQVSGMVTGIYGAVGAEQRNAGAPGLVRRYWDAYSAGLYLAIALIVFGSLWNVLLGIRDRRAQAA